MMEYFWASNGGDVYHMYRNLNFLTAPVAMCGKEIRMSTEFIPEGYERSGRYCQDCNRAYRETAAARDAFLKENGK